MYPNLFKIGPFTLHTYGLLLAIAFLAGLRISMHFARKEGLNPARIVDLVLYIFVSALLGAKFLHFIVDFNYYRQDWGRLLSIYQVGGVYYGGLVFAVVITAWYVRKHQMNFWSTADVLSMGLAAGQIFGRIGCFFAGCCWGIEAPSGFPIAVTFTNPLAAEQVGTPLMIALHPVQLYEAFLMLILVLILIFNYSRRKFTGQQFFLYLFCYSIFRFTVEFFRGDPRGSVLSGMISTSQLISIFLFAGAIWVYSVRRRTPAPAPSS
jgi:phosphatidylglycerol:prolipoprotein diacylglycerol transferase